MGSTVALLRSHLPSFPYVGMRRGGLSISSLHVRKAMTVLDFGFHVIDSGFQVVDTGVFVRGTWILDSIR